MTEEVRSRQPLPPPQPTFGSVIASAKHCPKAVGVPDSAGALDPIRRVRRGAGPGPATGGPGAAGGRSGGRAGSRRQVDSISGRSPTRSTGCSRSGPAFRPISCSRPPCARASPTTCRSRCAGPRCRARSAGWARPSGPGRGGDQEQSRARSIAVFSPKGVRSTTLATNLAVVLRRLTGKRTLLVDLDLELGEARSLGVRPRFNFVDLSRTSTGWTPGCWPRTSSGTIRGGPALRPLPAGEGRGGDRRPDPADPAVPPPALRVHHGGYVEVVLARHAGGVRAGRPGLPRDQRGPAVAAEHPARAAAAQAGAGARATTSAAGDQPVRSATIRSRSTTSSGRLGLKVFWKLSNDYEAVIGSINTGKPIVLNGRSSTAKDMKALGAQLAGSAARAGRRG